jgi:hypothetical protein
MTKESLLEWAASWVPDSPSGQKSRFVEDDSTPTLRFDRNEVRRLQAATKSDRAFERYAAAEVLRTVTQSSFPPPPMPEE